MNTGRTPPSPTPRTRLPAGVLYGFVAAVNLLLPASCAVAPRQVALSRLADPSSETPITRRRALLRDFQSVSSMVTPLTGNIGLLRVRDAREWDILQHAASTLGAAPDFRLGSIVGVVSRLGSRVDGAWPIDLRRVHVCERLGLVVAAAPSGCYLPDGLAYLELAWVPGLARVAVVEVDGQRVFVE